MAYHTEQKDRLLSYLSQHPGQQFTLGQLSEEVCQGGSIGTSTVYRLMGQLAKEGRVRRFMVGSDRRVYYQYVAEPACHSHLHLKCVGCGGLFHVSGALSELIEQQVKALHRFRLDEGASLLFGTCNACQRGARQ